MDETMIFGIKETKRMTIGWTDMTISTRKNNSNPGYPK